MVERKFYWTLIHNFMKTMVFLTLLFCSFNVHAQPIDCLKEFNFEDKGSIIFPEIINIDGSNEINQFLLNYIKKAFYIKSDKSLIHSLEEAKFKGLDSLTYLAFETDSTLSFALTFSLKRVDMLSSWVEFITFNKKTGKKLNIYDIFPNIEVCKVSNTLLSQIYIQIDLLKHKAYRLFSENKISNQDYLYIHFIIDKVLLGSIPYEDGFMLYKNHLYLKNGILLPQNINSSIPVFFIIDVNEFKVRAEMYNCFKMVDTYKD